MRKFIAIILIGSIFCVSSVVSAYASDLTTDQQHEFVMKMTVPCEVAPVFIPVRPAAKGVALESFQVFSNSFSPIIEARCNSPGYR